MPKVSVIIPCFNTGRHLGDAIRSVLDQTFADFEIVIVDDGSNDNTPEVVRSFEDSRIRYVWQENRGLPSARNTGIRASSGEYVAFLDADDWFLPRKLELQARFLDEHPEAGGVASGWIETDEQGRMLREAKPWHWKPSLGLTECVMGVPLTVHAALLRRYWLDAVGLFDERLHWREDWDLWLRLVADGCRFVWLPTVVCSYRLHGKNMARNAERMRDGGLAALDKLYARPDLPQEVRVMRKSAYAAVHVDAAARAYGARDVRSARRDVNLAIELDPSLLQGSPCRLIRMLVGWMDNPIIGDKGEYLDLLTRHLPSQVASTRWLVRKSVSSKYMDEAFAAYYHADWDAVRACLIHALRLDPTWLQNRGVLSIAARTFLPMLRQHEVTEADYHVEQ